MEPSIFGASRNSKIFIFPIVAECWHQDLLLFIFIWKALDEIYNLAVSKQDLKQFPKSDRLGCAGCVYENLPPEGAAQVEEKENNQTKQHKIQIKLN